MKIHITHASRMIGTLFLFCLPLLVASCDGNNDKQVQGNLYVSYNLAPDGRSIIFSGAGKGGKDLYSLSLTTRHVTRLTNSDAYENYPAFSPDGKQIVYQKAPTLEQPRYLFLRARDGSHVRQLTGGPFAADFYPSFSHDGKQVVFSRAVQFYGDKRGETTWNRFDVYTVRIDGTHMKRLTFGESVGFIRPIFSRDDKQILFEDTKEADLCPRICQITVGSSAPPKTVITYGTGAFAPSFFPDGKHVAIAGNLGFGSELYVTMLGKNAPVSLNTIRFGSGSGGADPKVFPDGRTIYFLIGYDSELWQIDADGTHGKRIATGDLFSEPMAAAIAK